MKPSLFMSQNEKHMQSHNAYYLGTESFDVRQQTSKFPNS